MNNSDVLRLIDDCQDELNNINGLVNSLGRLSNAVPYLNKYAIIRACGIIEVSYKTIVADFCDKKSKLQVKKFIKKRVRESSSNPSYDNICKLLKEFDANWNFAFKDKIKNHPDKARIITSVESLVAARNDFAHGGNPTLTISDVMDYFADFRIIMEILDDIVS